MFMENAILNADESYLLNRIKSVLKHLRKCKNDDTQLMDNADDANAMENSSAGDSMLAKCINQIIVDGVLFIISEHRATHNELFLEMFEQVLTILSMCLNNFPMTMRCFQRDYVNIGLCENIQVLKCHSYRSVLKFIEFLLNIDCERVHIFKEIELVSINSINSRAAASSSSEGGVVLQKRSCCVDIKLRVDCIRIMCEKYVSTFYPINMLF